MELNEIVRRIGVQHWRLLVVCVLLGIGAATLLHHGGGSYTASTRVVLDTLDPKSRPESAAIADTARGIATSPSEVADALRNVGATGRDADSFAKNNVLLEALGSSGVLQLSVKDRDPRIAAGVANALARQVLRTRLALSGGQMQQVLGALTKQIDSTNAQIARTDARMGKLALRIARTSDPILVNLLQARRNDAGRIRDSLAQRAAALESERVTILSTGAARPKAAVISAAARPAHPDSSGTVTALVLGFILGLVLGVGTAGVLETLRPTLVGSDAVAAELDTQLIGSLPFPPDADQPAQALAAPATLVRLAAERVAVDSAGLLAVGRPVSVDRLAAALHAELAGGAGPFSLPDAASSKAPADAASTRRRIALLIRPITPRALSAPGTGDRRVGLVLVAPDTLRKADLAEARHLLAIATVPVLGLVTYRSAPRGWARRTGSYRRTLSTVTSWSASRGVATSEEPSTAPAQRAGAGGGRS